MTGMVDWCPGRCLFLLEDTGCNPNWSCIKDHGSFHCWVERPKCCLGCHDAEDFLVGTFADWGQGKS